MSDQPSSPSPDSEESSADKTTLSLYVTQELLDELKIEAAKDHRKLSPFVSILLAKALSQHTGRNLMHLISSL